MLLGLSACDRTTAWDEPTAVRPISIRALKAYALGDVTALDADLSVRGCIMANNSAGEFFREVVIQDGTGGLTVRVDYPDKACPYPVGAWLEVYCNGLHLLHEGGRVVLGKCAEATEPWQQGATRYILAAERQHYLRLLDTTARMPEPYRCHIADLAAEQTDCYVRVEEVHFEETGRWCDLDSLLHPVTTERHVVDVRGDRLTVRTLGSCRYANDPLPEGSGSLCGIYRCYNGVNQLTVTGLEMAFIRSATPPKAYLSASEY